MTGDRSDERGDAPGVVRTCAICEHGEDEHEIIEDDAALIRRGVCTVCDDAHDFEPRPEDA